MLEQPYLIKKTLEIVDENGQKIENAVFKEWIAKLQSFPFLFKEGEDTEMREGILITLNKKGVSKIRFGAGKVRVNELLNWFTDNIPPFGKETIKDIIPDYLALELNLDTQEITFIIGVGNRRKIDFSKPSLIEINSSGIAFGFWEDVAVSLYSPLTGKLFEIRKYGYYPTEFEISSRTSAKYIKNCTKLISQKTLGELASQLYLNSFVLSCIREYENGEKEFGFTDYEQVFL